MKVIITGSTGMIGNLILNKCLQSDDISEVRTLVRKPTGSNNPKIKEFLVDDFSDYKNLNDCFEEIDLAFFCLGAYTGSVSTEMLQKITVDFAVAFAKKVEQHSSYATLCLLSGAGADRTETSKTPFALFKGMAENEIAKMKLNFYSFRPGYIYPVEPRKEPNFGYKIMRFLYPLIKIFGKNYSITSTDLANAMFNVSINGADTQILENKDILEYK